MEVWIVVGAAVVAVAPRVPGLRQVARTAVKGGMRVADTGRDMAVTAGEHWADLMAEAKSENPSGDEVSVPITVDGDPAS